ncbi:phospholipase [Pseudomonas sp. FW215-R2]|uniref:phospholipase n=1 Tax=unclassified Pseudomonas TaxID=196821 RepID=UPI000C888FEF|nr:MULTISPECIES: phospholipase [unclassified Pseudomonas]PMX03242.1 phospholipase [Pseudomonas sp. FW215-R2]PMX11792.1 phospholipase [Pseudomonas sp. FW215-L1]PMX25461.1 phospholipase [Pseudomonas sp. FW215-E1]PNA32463.1 phospholipase [Pseudomonas sp. FW215-R4]
MTDINNYASYNWMAATPSIDSLSISELTLPGTHNAGSDWRASYPVFGPPRHWLACQHDSFHAQLHHGARVLDIRLAYEPKAEGVSRFRAHHGGHRNSRTLGNLITDVENFLKQNPDEFIVLDFHSLDGNDFDYDYFNKMMIHLLGHRLIPSKNLSAGLGQLKHISKEQRVFAAARSHWQLDRHVFIDYINHEWSGSNRTDSAELKQFIGYVMKSPPGAWKPWSLSATCYTALGGPVDIHKELNEWFDPDNSDWAMKCNVINVDFIEETNIVSFCRAVNQTKAHQRPADRLLA